MNYLLDRYIFAFLPFNISDEWRHAISNHGMDAIRAADWFCKTQDIKKFYSYHTSFFAAELLYLLLSLTTFIHAYRHAGRYIYTWLATFLFAIVVQIFCIAYPLLDNQWFAQGLLTFWGGRIPMTAVLNLSLFTYIAYIFVQRMYLPIWAQGPAVGIAVLLIKLPFNIIGTKLVWWTWHVSEPLISDNFYGVPWLISAFDVSTVSSFTWVLYLSRKILVRDFYDWKRFVPEFSCVIITAVFAVLFGIIQILSLCFLIHSLKISASLVVVAFLSSYAVIVYIADRRNPNPELRNENTYWFDELSLAVCIHFVFLMLLILIAKPANVVSEGIHQPIGPCSAKAEFHIPMVYHKAKYLCLKRMEKSKNLNFDFHCIPGQKPPMSGEEFMEWYAICGVSMNAEQHAELFAIIFSLCIFALTILYQAAAKSGKTPRIYRIIYQTIGMNKNN